MEDTVPPLGIGPRGGTHSEALTVAMRVDYDRWSRDMQSPLVTSRDYQSAP
jgi:hypothetical protein